MIAANEISAKVHKVLVIISCGTNNPNRSVRELHLASASKVFELACSSKTLSL